MAPPYPENVQECATTGRNVHAIRRTPRAAAGPVAPRRHRGHQGRCRGTGPVRGHPRRDLRDLAAAGLCQRVYGGALPASPAVAHSSARTAVEPASKQRVAARAVALLRPRSTVLLDGGTTPLAVVHALPPGLACTVITHSPTIAVALLPADGVDVFLLGGRLFKHSAVTCGAAAAEAAR